jgi:BirA family biotin operon repressor/biotin-[acetyl-CoA-carboxylase] ligase
MQTSPTASCAPPGSPRVPLEESWTLHEHRQLTSTNLVARALPAWHAVRADTQTGGYGRTGRTWVSDAGGLWISAVLPTPGPSANWAILPLAAGWAVTEVLVSLGLQNPRVRWPNDIMIGKRKLAGLLLERFSPDTAVVGLGMNVFNRPGLADTTLAGTAVTLAELLPAPGTLAEITTRVLSALRAMHEELLNDGFGRIAADLSGRRLRTARVELNLTGHHTPLRGRFRGIDSTGRLKLTTDDGVSAVFAAHEVALLREID